MARAINQMAVLAVIMAAAALCSPTTAQSTSGCTSTLLSLMPCLNYINGNSSSPSSSCCSQLASVVQSQPQCLCLLLNGGASSVGITVNSTRALELPGACKVQTPPASRCNAVPPSSPKAAPTTPSSPSTPSVPSVPSGGTKDVPSTVGASSDGTSNKIASSFLLVVVLIASGLPSITGFLAF